MRSIWATHANSYCPVYPTKIHPALARFADECCGTLAHLIAYVGALALLAIVGIHLWDELPASVALEPLAKADWSPAARSYPAFAVSRTDSVEKTESYEIFRHPEGAARTSSTGQPETQSRAKRRLQNWKSIVPAVNWPDQELPSRS
jgi:hypothetical protein